MTPPAAAPDAFGDSLEAPASSAWAVHALIAVNVIVWVATVVAGVDPVSPDPADLTHWGGNAASQTLGGQWWRLGSAILLHAGLVHLVLNMLALWEIGRLAARVYGNGQLLLVYTLSGLMGSALSLHYSAQQSVSVGASGAVFGVMGALITALLQHRDRLPSGQALRLALTMAAFGTLSLLNGLRPGIDNAAHIGGLVGGALVGAVLVKARPAGPSGPRRRPRQALALGLCAAWVTGLVLLAPQPTQDLARAYETSRAFAGAQAEWQHVMEAVQHDAALARERRITAREFEARAESVHRPAVEALRERLQRLSVPPESAQARLVALQLGMIDVLLQSLALDRRQRLSPMADYPARDAALQAEMARLHQAAQALAASASAPRP